MSATTLFYRLSTESEQRALLALMAYAAGDAFGVAYEYLPEKVAVDISVISPRIDWPLGGVSDDTLLSLLTIHAVEPGDPVQSSANFLLALHAAIPVLRGLGPTTRAALGMDVKDDEVALIGHTNGGMMRTSLLGLAYGPGQAEERRVMVSSLAEATHIDPSAVACAVLCAGLYSRALSLGAEPVIESLRAEAVLHDSLPLDVLDMVAGIDKWSAPAVGISLNPVETLAAVVWVVANARDCAHGYQLSCEMGGDTDTVAALAGGLIAARGFEVAEFLSIGWIDQVMWSEIDEISLAATSLSQMRES